MSVTHSKKKVRYFKKFPLTGICVKKNHEDQSQTPIIAQQNTFNPHPNWDQSKLSRHGTYVL